MAKTKTKFVVRPTGETKAIYSDRDRDLLDRLGAHTERRASHIDPLEPVPWYMWFLLWLWPQLFAQRAAYRKYGRGHFAIYWRGEVSSWLPVFSDEMGTPFRTKAEAEEFEVARLERDYFGTRSSGPLLLEVLKTERDKANGDLRVVSADGSPDEEETVEANGTQDGHSTT